MNFKTIILIFTNNLIFGQQNLIDNKGVVLYSQIESSMFGTKNGQERLACLIFDKTKSSYVCQKDSLDAILNSDSHESFKISENDGGTITTGLPATTNGSQVYTDMIKDSVYSSLLRGGLNYFSEKKSTIKWDLLNETKKIGNFNCNYAKTIFRGRIFFAWYTTEIPIPFGPWKLQGLPGLILEANDEKMDVVYFFKSMIYPADIKIPISKIKKPKNIKWKTFKEYLSFCQENIDSNYEKILIISKELKIEQKVSKNRIEDVFKEISE